MIMSDKLLIYLSTFLTKRHGCYFKTIHPMIDRVAEKTNCSYTESFHLDHGELHLKADFRSERRIIVRANYVLPHRQWTRLGENGIIEAVHKVFKANLREEVLFHLCMHGVSQINEINSTPKQMTSVEEFALEHPKAYAQMLKTKDIALKRFEEKVDEDFLILRKG